MWVAGFMTQVIQETGFLPLIPDSVSSLHLQQGLILLLRNLECKKNGCDIPLSHSPTLCSVSQANKHKLKQKQKKDMMDLVHQKKNRFYAKNCQNR